MEGIFCEWLICKNSPGPNNVPEITFMYYYQIFRLFLLAWLRV